MLNYAPVGIVLFLSKRLACWALVTRVGNVRFHIHRSTNVRFRVGVGPGIDLDCVFLLIKLLSSKPGGVRPVWATRHPKACLGLVCISLPHLLPAKTGRRHRRERVINHV